MIRLLDTYNRDDFEHALISGLWKSGFYCIVFVCLNACFTSDHQTFSESIQGQDMSWVH